MGMSSACVNGSLMGVKPSGCGVLAGGRPVLADRRKLQLRTSFDGSQLGGKGPSTDAPIISSMSCLRGRSDVKDFSPFILVILESSLQTETGGAQVAHGSLARGMCDRRAGGEEVGQSSGQLWNPEFTSLW